MPLKNGPTLSNQPEPPLTEDLFGALKPIGVKLLDHLVIGAEAVFSFAGNGLMDEIALTA